MSGRAAPKKRVKATEYIPVKGSALRRIRYQRDLTVPELARRSEVGRGTITRLEGSSDGCRTSADNLKRLAGALGVPVAYFTEGNR